MKAAFLFHDTDYYSGGTRSLLDLMDTFLERGRFEMLAVTPRESGTAVDYLREKGIPVISSRYGQNKVLLDEGILRYFWRLPGRCRELASTVRHARQLSNVLLKEGVDVLYSNTGFVITGALLKRYMKTPYHIWHIREFGEEDHRFGIFFGRKLFYRLVNRYTDRVVVISMALYGKFAGKIREPELSVIYDDISECYDQFREEDYTPGEPLRILMAGLICPGKGQMQAVRAVKCLKDWGIPAQLFLAGGSVDRRYMEELKDFIGAHGLEEEVRFLGVVKDMNGLRRRMHLGIVASGSEAFGRVTVEGMLSGMLMIGADAGGTAELISHGVTGMTYPWNDYERLAGRIRQVYQNPRLYSRIRRAGYEFALGFTKGHCADAIEAMILAGGDRDNGTEADPGFGPAALGDKG